LDSQSPIFVNNILKTTYIRDDGKLKITVKTTDIFV